MSRRSYSSPSKNRADVSSPRQRAAAVTRYPLDSYDQQRYQEARALCVPKRSAYGKADVRHPQQVVRKEEPWVPRRRHWEEEREERSCRSEDRSRRHVRSEGRPEGRSEGRHGDREYEESPEGLFESFLMENGCDGRILTKKGEYETVESSQVSSFSFDEQTRATTRSAPSAASSRRSATSRRSASSCRSSSRRPDRDEASVSNSSACVSTISALSNNSARQRMLQNKMKLPGYSAFKQKVTALKRRQPRPGPIDTDAANSIVDMSILSSKNSHKSPNSKNSSIAWRHPALRAKVRFGDDSPAAPLRSVLRRNSKSKYDNSTASHTSNLSNYSSDTSWDQHHSEGASLTSSIYTEKQDHKTTNQCGCDALPTNLIGGCVTCFVGKPQSKSKSKSKSNHKDKDKNKPSSRSIQPEINSPRSNKSKKFNKLHSKSNKSIRKMIRVSDGKHNEDDEVASFL